MTQQKTGSSMAKRPVMLHSLEEGQIPRHRLLPSESQAHQGRDLGFRNSC